MKRSLKAKRIASALLAVGLSGCASTDTDAEPRPALLTAQELFASSDIVEAIEYYHPVLDHYFMTIDAAEIAALDSGTIAGWVRTGLRFGVFKPSSNVADTHPVCRFYGRPEAGLNSHFFTASADECLAVQRDYAASWQLESSEAFRVLLPDFGSGACAAGTKPVHRLYNGRADANHRYLTDPEVFAQMKKLGHTPEGYGDVNLPVVMCSPVVTSPPRFQGRRILEPHVAVDPSNMFFVDHLNKPMDRFYLNARYQRPDPKDANSSPVRFVSSFNGAANTGLGPLPSEMQRGPLGGSGDQSLFQLGGTSVGILMRSWDSPHPSTLPSCQPNCDGYQKHTVFEYRWSAPPKLFTAPDPSRALVIESDVQVKQFEEFNVYTGGGPKGVLAGALAYVLFLRDPNGKTIQYVIYIFDSNLLTYNAEEYVAAEVIGADTSSLFVSSSMKKKLATRYSTPDSANDGDFGDKTWLGFRRFRTRLTVENIRHAIADLNARGSGLSNDVYAYTISHVGLNQEVYYENNGDAWVMGSSFRNLSVREQ